MQVHNAKPMRRLLGLAGILFICVACKKTNELGPPAVAGIAPAQVTWNAPFTVTGSNFNTAEDATTLRLQATGGAVTPVAVQQVTSTSIVAASPTGLTAGAYTLFVATPAGEANAGVFTIAPAILSLSANTGAADATVNILGSAFSTALNSNVVVFRQGSNSFPAAVQGSTQTSISVQVPALACEGAYTIQVSVQNLTATSTPAFTITQPNPTVSGVNPTSGAAFTSVTLTGTNFRPLITQNAVSLTAAAGGAATQANLTSASASQLVFTVPSVATGSYNVSVLVNGCKAVSAGSFTVN